MKQPSPMRLSPRCMGVLQQLVVSGVDVGAVLSAQWDARGDGGACSVSSTVTPQYQLLSMSRLEGSDTLIGNPGFSCNYSCRWISP